MFQELLLNVHTGEIANAGLSSKFYVQYLVRWRADSDIYRNVSDLNEESDVIAWVLVIRQLEMKTLVAN